MIGRIILLCALLVSGAALGAEPFQAPFAAAPTVDVSEPLGFDLVLSLVAEHNPTLRELDFVERSAEADLGQAGIRALPELELGVEEVGWDAPGFSNAEFGLSVSQGLEMFGRRQARIRLAEAGVQAVKLEASVAAFDLYLDAKQSFLDLAFAQELVRMQEASVELSQQTLDNLVSRIEKGAALQAELLLARLDLQRSLLNLAEAEQRLATARIELASLWGGTEEGIALELGAWDELDELVTRVERAGLTGGSSRLVLTLGQQVGILEAEQQLARAEGRPDITLMAGVKRQQADRSNSIMFGVSLPLPLWQSNKGAVESLRSKLIALQFRAERERLSADAKIRAATGRLREMTSRLEMIDAQLLHTAEEAYATLSEAHRAGRVPYTSLLEAERWLIELRLERNDVVLAIHETVISLERLSGQNLGGLGKKE